MVDPHAVASPAPIISERLLLAPFILANTDEHYQALVSDPQVARWLPGGQPGSYAESPASSTPT